MFTPVSSTPPRTHAYAYRDLVPWWWSTMVHSRYDHKNNRYAYNYKNICLRLRHLRRVQKRLTDVDFEFLWPEQSSVSSMPDGTSNAHRSDASGQYIYWRTYTYGNYKNSRVTYNNNKCFCLLCWWIQKNRNTVKNTYFHTPLERKCEKSRTGALYPDCNWLRAKYNT